MPRPKDPRKRVMEALSRLAFESAAEKLVVEQNEAGGNMLALTGLDPFHISELRQIKGGGVEIKFYDRVRAMEKLYELSRNEDDTLIEALRDGAKVWEEADGA